MPLPTLREHYSTEEFCRLIAGEGDRIELKTGTSSKPLQEAIVAFSNTDGGLLFIGVDDNRQVVGRHLDPGTEEQIHRVAAVDAHHVGRYHIRQIIVDQKPVVVVEVSRREDGFAQTSDGRILVRRGPRNQALIGDEVWRLASSRTLRRFEQSSAGVRRDQVDDELLQRTCVTCGWDQAAADLNDRLRERGLLGADDKLTIAGALLLTDPVQTLKASKLIVEIRWYGSAGQDYLRRMTIGGPLQEQVRTAAQTVINELGSYPVITGIHRRDLPRLPPVVVREAIANAVAHRSYERDQSAIIIDIRPQQVVVTSPGRLPEGVTVATMRHAQAARNPSVIAVLRKFGLTEDAGRGVDVMQDVMRDEMLDPPVFEEVGDFLRVTLPINGPIAPEERAWLKDLEELGTLDPAERLLLVRAARREPVMTFRIRGGKLLETGESTIPRRLTNAEARKVTGLGRDEARTALKRLRDHGFLIQHGQRGGAYYLLNPTLIRGAAHGMTDEEIEQLVLDAAKQRAIKNEDVRRLTGLDSNAVGSMLRRLTERGLLERRGEKRGTEYMSTGS